MNDPRCKCSIAISMLGDGCRYCQPQEHIERMGEWLNEERDEITALQTENEKLREKVTALLEASIMAIEHYEAFFKGIMPPEDLPWVPVMRSAIAKATGEET